MNLNKTKLKLKSEFISLLSYVPEEHNNFSILQNNSSANIDGKYKNVENVFTNIKQNLDYLKMKYNTLINSDVIIREFTVNIRNKQYDAFLLYIDGMIDSKIMNEFVIEPIMTRSKNTLYDGIQNKVVPKKNTNHIKIRKVHKFNIDNYLMNCLIPQNTIEKINTFKEVFLAANSGNCVLFVNTLLSAFSIEVKGFKQRSVDSPANEIIIKGPQEAFVENLRTNTSLIRRIINNENLVMETIAVGSITKTKCAVCYIKNLTNDSLVSEVKFRLNNLKVDTLLSAGELEQLISDYNEMTVPKILSTERPDKSTKYLLQGRVVVIINGSPYALIMPATLIDFISSPEDTNLNYKFGNFLRGLRILASFFTLLLPGIYVAITGFHQEILPTELLHSILTARESVPFPIIFEILTMEISFELIREAGLRIPSPVGPTIGIVGALVLGQAAVSAGIVSPILIIIVALTGISSLAIPDYSFGFHLRYYRFAFILLGYISVFLGISIGLFVYISGLTSVKSFGVFYTTPFAPSVNSKGNSYFLQPMWKREYRSTFLSPKKKKSQPHISMKWDQVK